MGMVVTTRCAAMKPFKRNAMMIEARRLGVYIERLGIAEATSLGSYNVFRTRFGVTPLERMVATNHMMSKIWEKSTNSSPTNTHWTLSHLNTYFYTQGGLAAFMLQMDERWEPNEIVSLLNVKQDMYGPANLSLYGEIGIVIRISDKISRLQTLTDNKAEVVNKAEDGIHDTLSDIVGYSILGLIMVTPTLA